MFWLEDGRSFAIDREGYKKNLMSVFFRQNKFTSLQSNMSRYGFARELDSFDGLVFVVYSHPSGHFVQEDPDQSIKICPLPKPIDYRAAATSKSATSKRRHESNTGMGERAQEETMKSSHQPPNQEFLAKKRLRLMAPTKCKALQANHIQARSVSEDEVSNGSTKREEDLNPGHATNDNFEKAAVSTVHMEAKYDTKSDHKEPAATARAADPRLLAKACKVGGCTNQAVVAGTCKEHYGAAGSAPSTPKGTTDTRRAAARVWQSDKDIEDRRDMIVKM